MTGNVSRAIKRISCHRRPRHGSNSGCCGFSLSWHAPCLLVYKVSFRHSFWPYIYCNISVYCFIITLIIKTATQLVCVTRALYPRVSHQYFIYVDTRLLSEERVVGQSYDIFVSILSRKGLRCHNPELQLVSQHLLKCKTMSRGISTRVEK